MRHGQTQAACWCATFVIVAFIGIIYVGERYSQAPGGGVALPGLPGLPLGWHIIRQWWREGPWRSRYGWCMMSQYY
jgi:hypothetical protein